MRKFLHSLTITFILVGLLVGYAKADYSYDPFNLYNRYYYVWDKGVVILMGLCVMYPLKQYKWAWFAVVCFFCVREVWELFAIQDYATASRPSIIFGLFLINLFVICFLMFLPELKKAWKVWIQPLRNK